jgi:hypothetical protein
MCVHKNIKMSNLWQPFADARRLHVTFVVKILQLIGGCVSYDVTGWQLCTSVAPPFLWQLASVVADVISVCVELLVGKLLLESY